MKKKKNVKGINYFDDMQYRLFLSIFRPAISIVIKIYNECFWNRCYLLLQDKDLFSINIRNMT